MREKKGAGLVGRPSRLLDIPRRLEMLPIYFVRVVCAQEVLPTPSERGDTSFFRYGSSKFLPNTAIGGAAYMILL